MAVSLGFFSSVFARESVSFVKPSSSAVKVVPGNLSVRTVTVMAAPKPDTETKKREPRGIMKPRRVSPEMQAFLGGVAEIPRTQALKEIWAHIKQHNLQVYMHLDEITRLSWLNFCIHFIDCLVQS